MAGSSHTHEIDTQHPEALATARHDHLALLGRPPTARSSEVHPEGAAASGRPVGRVTTTNVLRLLEFQNHRCALTGRQLTPETASLDHIVPVRCGGAHAIENTQVLHKEVNRAKSTLTNEQFIRLCQEVVNHVLPPADGGSVRSRHETGGPT